MPRAKRKAPTRQATAPSLEPAADETDHCGALEIPEGADVKVSPPNPGEVRCWARLPMGYDGRELDRGQEVVLSGCRNDEKLVRLGYVREIKKGERGSECGVCHENFRTEQDRDAHGKKRHSDRFARLSGPEREYAEEQAELREDRETARDNPLHMDRTAAALG